MLTYAIQNPNTSSTWNFNTYPEAMREFNAAIKVGFDALNLLRSDGKTIHTYNREALAVELMQVWTPETKQEHVTCPDCYGEGHAQSVTARYNTAYGNYLPHETYTPCETCDGEGAYWVPVQTADSVDMVYSEVDYQDAIQVMRQAA